VAEAALDAGCDYLDVNYSRAKYAALEALRSRVEISGRCFITDAGFHPGLPAALVRRAASMLDSIETANVVSLIQMDWRGLDLRPATIEEFAAELAEYDSRYYRDGEWRKASLWSTKDFRKADFGPPFGTRQCAPMFFEELRELPERFPTLREAGFFIAGFNPVTDFLIMPLTIIAYRISPRTLGPAAARLMYWALRRFSKPPFETLLRVDATGPLNGQPTSATITLRHPDGYVMTAVPVVACLLQWLDGTTRTPGIHTMGNLVEPERLLRDMVRMGVPVDARIVAGVRYRQNA
jgi:saccharopine dehydrogenase (NAD+, L-lysine-forming)